MIKKLCEYSRIADNLKNIIILRDWHYNFS